MAVTAWMAALTAADMPTSVETTEVGGDFPGPLYTAVIAPRGQESARETSYTRPYPVGCRRVGGVFCPSRG